MYLQYATLSTIRHARFGHLILFTSYTEQRVDEVDEVIPRIETPLRPSARSASLRWIFRLGGGIGLGRD
jgi:hypothetical protein